MLQSLPWPGNVRELQHAVERAVILSAEPMLGPGAFDAQRFGLAHEIGDARAAPLHASRAERAERDGADDGAFDAERPTIVLHTLNVAEAEEVLIQKALQATDNNRTRAAELLGMSVRTLRSKLNSPEAEARVAEAEAEP
jgi:DNA-binding NtrC family response regulator